MPRPPPGKVLERHVRTVREVRTVVTRLITDVYYKDGAEVERSVVEVSAGKPPPLRAVALARILPTLPLLGFSAAAESSAGWPGGCSWRKVLAASFLGVLDHLRWQCLGGLGCVLAPLWCSGFPVTASQGAAGGGF